MATWLIELRPELPHRGLSGSDLLFLMAEVAKGRSNTPAPTVYRWRRFRPWLTVAVMPPFATRRGRDEWFQFTLYDHNDELSELALHEILTGVCPLLGRSMFKYRLSLLDHTWRT